MSNQQTQDKVVELGYCCIYRFITVMRDEGRWHYRSSQLREMLQCAPRTVRELKQRVRTGDLTCLGVVDCQQCKGKKLTLTEPVTLCLSGTDLPRTDPDQ